MRAAEAQYNIGKNRVETPAFRGINYSQRAQEGDLAESKNLSTRRYPYLSPRRGRTKQAKADGTLYEGVTALTAWDAPVAVAGTDLLYNGEKVGEVTAGEKQFAVVNTKIVIWPDQVALDMNAKTLKPLGAKNSGSEAVFTKNTMQIGWIDDLEGSFAAGDAITISGCETYTANNKDVIIRAVKGSTITVDADTFTAGAEKGKEITLERVIPDMDFICEAENRLWGCSSAAQTIYVSALGDPTNFNLFDGLTTDSYAVAVGTEGAFTGCCKLSSSVLFWKETKLHKMLGSYPAEFAMYTYDVEGLRAGCHKSLQVINEVLYYIGQHGIYRYEGGAPALISDCFGERLETVGAGVGGTDGAKYYLCLTEEDGTAALYVYDTYMGLWLREDETDVVDFARVGRKLYYCDRAGGVYLADNGAADADVEWVAQMTPSYETIQGRKSYSKLLMRVEIPRGGYLIAETRYDGGIWTKCGQVVGPEQGLVAMRPPQGRCDKFELRLRGKGDCTVLGLMREFEVRSEV